eukprot:TRINITY_DN7861_c0_g1_i5.p1 TRINITY_DN7861_c0_g1~~TRINITY_DN7861_c0_g1_i5.p1  ORF type:complete len:188 (+),score=69.02 TRINITY_DN7861_c0_g1_i5:266-829(+)
MVKDFSLHDPVFDTAKSPKKLRENEEPCAECAKPPKNRKQCKFCGAVHYGGCIKEKRLMGYDNKMHNICETCSFKFFLKELYDEYSEKIGKCTTELRAKKKELQGCIEEYNKVHEEQTSLDCKYKDLQEKQTKEIENLKAKIKRSKDNQHNFSKEIRQFEGDREGLSKEINEARQKHDEVSVELSNL